MMLRPIEVPGRKRNRALAGYDYTAASHGNYARIGPTPYTNAFNWYRVMGGPTYSWYVYTSGGTLQGSGISQTNPNGGWSGGYNYRYWKFYNGSLRGRRVSTSTGRRNDTRAEVSLSPRVTARGPLRSGPLALMLVTVAAAAGCGLEGSSSAEKSSTGRIVTRGPSAARARVDGGTAVQRRLLRTLISASGATSIRRVVIGALSRKAGLTSRWLTFDCRPTDRVSSTRGKWRAMLVGTAFADASAQQGLPRIGGMTIDTPELPAGEGRRLAAGRATFPSVVMRRLKDLIRRDGALGIEVRRLELVRLREAGAEAVELTGVLRDPGTYLRVISETAAASPVAKGAYYELTDPGGRAIVRFGIVHGIAPPDRLVGWVRPDLLRQD